MTAVLILPPRPRLAQAPRPPPRWCGPENRGRAPGGWFQCPGRIEARCCTQWQRPSRSRRPRCSICGLRGRLQPVGHQESGRPCRCSGGLRILRRRFPPAAYWQALFGCFGCSWWCVHGAEQCAVAPHAFAAVTRDVMHPMILASSTVFSAMLGSICWHHWLLRGAPLAILLIPASALCPLWPPVISWEPPEKTKGIAFVDVPYCLVWRNQAALQRQADSGKVIGRELVRVRTGLVI